MELGKKILELRKKKGLSQEELGERVNVTRQTISNWELGETSPNTEQLKLLSKELNVSIDELLDNDIQNVLVEKVSNTEQLAGLILKIIKFAIFFVIGVFLLLIIVSIAFRVIRSREDTGREITESIHCNLYGEEHSYTITYQELTGRPIALGGDTYFDDILDLDKYEDAHQMFNVINDYVKKNGGSCSKIEGEDANDLVSMYVKEGTLTKKGVTLILEMPYDYEVTFGEYYKLEKLNNNNYEEVKDKEECAYNDIAYILNKDESREVEVNWSYCKGELSKGTYRLSKDVFFESDVPIDGNDKYYIWTEFTID